MLRNSYFRNAARLLLYGGLAGFIFYTQPVPRCLLNPFSERDLLAVCRYASEVVFLSQEFSAYAATDAINMYLQRGQIDEAVALSDRAIGRGPGTGHGQSIHILLAEAEMSRRRNDHVTAIKYLDEVLKRDASMGRAHAIKAEILAGPGR